MNRAQKYLGAASALALATSATPAFAAGTVAGAPIENEVTVTFNVGGVAQTAAIASDTFTVDRKVNLTVEEDGTTTTQVSPGDLAAVTAFNVTNTSNDTLDFGLAVTQQTGGAGAHSNTDTFDVSNIRIYIDENADGLLDSGDTLVTYLDEVAPDETIEVLVVVEIDDGRVTDDVAAVTLTATAQMGGTANDEGDVLDETTGANTAGVDTVFADDAGAADLDEDGKFSAKDDYTVLAAALTVTKTSSIVSDPHNGTTNPKAIPGAVIEYCIRVDNAADSATATDLAITDDLESALLQSGAISIKGPVDAPANPCTAANTGTGSISGTTVSGSLPDLAAGKSAALVFQTTIQ